MGLFRSSPGREDAGRILDALSPLARTLIVVPVRSDRTARLLELRLAAVGRFPRYRRGPLGGGGTRARRAGQARTASPS